MDQPPAAKVPAAKRRWTESVVVDLVIAILLAWPAGWLGGELGSDTWIVGGGLAGAGLAFLIAGWRAPSGRLAARVRELYLCLASVCMGLEVIRCLLIASGRNPDCGCEVTDAMAARAWGGLPESVGYELVILVIPALLGGGLAWLIRRRRARSRSCAS